MQYEIYLDVLFAENLMMNYFLLRLTVLLLANTATKWRSLASSALGAAVLVLWITVFRWCPRIVCVLIGIGVTSGMVKFGCNTKTWEELVRGWICLCLSSFLLCGAIRVLQRIAGTKGVRTTFTAAAAGYGITCCLILIRRQIQKAQNKTVLVLLQMQGRWKKVKGLYDTGNSLRDTTTGKPVSVIPYEFILELFPDEMRKGIAELMEHKEVTNPELLIKLQPHYISFRGINGSGLLPVIRITEMVLIQGNTKKCIQNPVIALTGWNSSSPRGYEMILHPDLMDR
ncbi:MAG: sigma-E processing peptidase SpoIIGA [Fusicatenibacter sp.]|nr:sigma-E processing peptidase SpoIIGA [Fusicatenibacter sp.]